MRWSIYPFRVWPMWVPTIPKLYWDSESQEQRLKYLSREYDHLRQYIDYMSEEISKSDVASEKDFLELKKSVNNALDDMRKTIATLESGVLIWDVTRGLFNDNVEAMRDTFRDVTVHGITCEELAEMEYTVETLSTSGLNVRGLATYGQWLYDTSEDLPTGLGI